MKKHILSLLSILFVLISYWNINWELSGRIYQAIYNPENIWILHDDNLLVNDIGMKSSPLNLIDFKTDSVISSLREGRGPGETSSTFYKRVTQFSDGDILLWDAGLNRITKFSDSLKYKTEIRGPALEKKLYQVALVNDSTLFTIDNSEQFMRAWRLGGNQVDNEDELWSISRSEYKELSPLSNFILLQTLYYTNYDGVLYIAFEFSSLIMAIDENGIQFINDEPDQIALPVHQEKGGNFSLPVMGQHPEGARDISADEDYLYVTFSGETTSKWEQIRYALNFDTLIERIKHSERVLIFQRKTGEFVGEIKLPLRARKFKVAGDHIFLLNTIDDKPEILKYRFKKTLYNFF